MNIQFPLLLFLIPVLILAGLILVLVLWGHSLTVLIKRLHLELLQSIVHIATARTGSTDVSTSVFYLQGEIMLTAGPRKKKETGKNNDLDLGEDVCGLAIARETAWFWLLDGTSDQSTLVSSENSRDLFSSRLLAQALAAELKYIYPQKLLIPDILNAIIEKIRQDWLIRLENLSLEERHALGRLVTGNNPICSSTILIGSLTLNGQCKAYRSGDSKLLIFGDDHPEIVVNPLKEHPGPKNDRLFFRLVYTDEQGFDIEYNRPKLETHTFQGINKLVAYSDGVGNELQEYLNSFQSDFSEESRRLLPYLRNMTSDDKSLCILERLEEKNFIQ